MKGLKKAWGKGGRGAAAIFNNAVFGDELPESQKQGLRDFRVAINGTSSSSQQELETQRQVAQQAEAAKAQAQAEQQAAAQREATARAQEEAANAEAARLRTEAASLQAQLDAANARAVAAQEAKRIAELKAQLAQLNQTQPEPAASGVVNIEKKEAHQKDDHSLETMTKSASSAEPAAASSSSPSVPNYQPDSEEVRSQELKTKLTRLAKSISDIASVEDAADIERAKEQVRKDVYQSHLSRVDFVFVEKSVVESFGIGVITPPDIDKFLNELEDSVTMTGESFIDLTN